MLTDAPAQPDVSARRVGRLTKRHEFVAAATGRRFHSERMTVQGRLRDPAEAPDSGLRIGLTVTKKVGHATERNRIKRRLRHATREALARHDAARGPETDAAAQTPPLTAPPEPLPEADIVVIARRPALEAAYSSLIDDFVRALHVVTKPGGARPGGSRPAGRGARSDKPAARAAPAGRREPPSSKP